MEKLDFKKAYPDLYPKNVKPHVVDVPAMTFFAVDGKGDPNRPDGEYARSLELLYALSYTVKMSRRAGVELPGFAEYGVPPLEGLWDNAPPITDKAGLSFTSMIRQPSFVDRAVFAWACDTVARKKGLDTAKARLFAYTEGLAVQCLHVGSYDDEPRTMAIMTAFACECGLIPDVSPARRHHEIYMGDPRRTAPERLKTVLRLPVRPK